MAEHPIEERSYEIMRARVDFSTWAGGEKAVVERIVHATADETFATTVRIGERAVASAVKALAAGAPVVCDSRMVLAGVPRVPGGCCHLGDGTLPTHAGMTRSAAAVDRAAAAHPAGAVWVFGNAPTALDRLLSLAATGQVTPAAVVGLPVGYVGAAEAKQALRCSSLAPLAVTNTGERGGSSPAAAAVNALARLAGVWRAP